MRRFQPLRAAFHKEVLPSGVLWLMAADAMSLYLRALVKALSADGRPRPESKRIVAELFARMGRRRYAVMRAQYPHLPAPSDAHVAAVLRGLYPTPGNRRTRWMYAALGHPPSRLRGIATTARLTARLGPQARWDELSTHLGDLLIVSTQSLSTLGVARGNQVIARMCLQAGVAYGEHFKARYDLPDTAEAAIEVLRMGEYIWQVNPIHHSAFEGRSGYIEGDACPWYRQAGWQHVHCGIFGQFQNGVASVFGMKYSLTRTIPRHGGDRCRIDLVSIGEPRGRAARSVRA
jgi:hypothetical protein